MNLVDFVNSAAANFRLIPLTQGRVAIVDPEDFPAISSCKWRHAQGYAVRSIPDGAKRQRTVQMHRVLIGTPDGLDTDHKNGDGLDNRRRNLRPATRTQNMRNAAKYACNGSGYKGVSFRRDTGGWRARIRVNGKLIDLGTHETLEDAHNAYSKSAELFYGEFARPK